MEYGPRRRMMGKIGDVCLGNERKTSSSLLGQKLNQKKKRRGRCGGEKEILK